MDLILTPIDAAGVVGCSPNLAAELKDLGQRFVSNTLVGP